MPSLDLLIFHILAHSARLRFLRKTQCYYYELLISRHSGMAHVHEITQLYLPSTRLSTSGMPAAERHRTLAGTQFPVPLTAGG